MILMKRALLASLFWIVCIVLVVLAGRFWLTCFKIIMMGVDQHQFFVLLVFTFIGLGALVASISPLNRGINALVDWFLPIR